MGDEYVLKEAVRRWGPEAQLRQLQEECAELIAAVNHVDRGRCSIAKLAEEIADVRIMIEQASIIVGKGRVAEQYCRKMDRLRARLEVDRG